ncbi:hypothetical protein FB451DRAFT_1507072 [Mycena latifolia]|nr:hypothetical protein FB451DRAFT_1507072 [Mycena latifolia]
MQLKAVLLPLVILASGTNIQATPTAILSTPNKRDVAIAGEVQARADCNYCECFTALAGEGIACAAAILEGGCNILADISCIIDATAFSQAIPSCLACLRNLWWWNSTEIVRSLETL